MNEKSLFHFLFSHFTEWTLLIVYSCFSQKLVNFSCTWKFAVPKSESSNEKILFYILPLFFFSFTFIKYKHLHLFLIIAKKKINKLINLTRFPVINFRTQISRGFHVFFFFVASNTRKRERFFIFRAIFRYSNRFERRIGSYFPIIDRIFHQFFTLYPLDRWLRFG